MKKLIVPMLLTLLILPGCAGGIVAASIAGGIAAVPATAWIMSPKETKATYKSACRSGSPTDAAVCALARIRPNVGIRRTVFSTANTLKALRKVRLAEGTEMSRTVDYKDDTILVVLDRDKAGYRAAVTYYLR